MAKHAIDDLAVIISANTEQLAGDLRAAVRMFESFKKDIAKNSAGAPLVDVSGLRASAAAIQSISAHARAAAASVGSIAAKAAVATATFGALQLGAAGVSGAFDQARESVNMAADLEQTTLAFEVMLGSAADAKRMLGEIRQFAASTPFNTKELTDSARQLTAYGIAADQVIPTLRMLGDVAAGSGDRLKIGNLTYLYGTLAAQGRAYTKDINQFTNAGIEILPQLSKQLGITTGEVTKFVEEGRVGFPEVLKAFKDMTGEGGRFYQMTARQSKTFAGMREAAFDAFDLMKTKFGQVVIDEFGLKDAAKDFDTFAKDVTAHMDRVRPAVRFAGDAVKGLVQGSYELARAGGVIGAIGVEQIGAAWPGVKAMADSVRQMVADAQNFKFDRGQVVDFGVAAGQAVITAVGAAIEITAKFGEAFWANVVAPVLDAAKEITKAIRDMRALTSGRLGFPMHPPIEDVRKAATEKFNSMFVEIPKGDAPPVPQEYPADIVARYKALTTSGMAKAAAEFQKGNKAALDDNLAARERFRGAFADPAAAGGELLAGRVPAFKAAGLAESGAARIKTLTGFDVASLRDAGRRIKEEFAVEAAATAAAKLAESTATARGAMEWFAQVFTGPVAAVGVAAMRVESSLEGLNATIFRDAVLSARVNAGQVREMTGPSPTLYEFVNSIKDDLDPTRKLKIDLKQIDQAQGFGLLNRDQADAARTRRVRSLAEHLGAGGEPQLADAAIVGSAEDARLLTRHQAGGGAQRTDDLLQQAVEVLQRMEKQDAAANRRGVRIFGFDI